MKSKFGYRRTSVFRSDFGAETANSGDKRTEWLANLPLAGLAPRANVLAVGYNSEVTVRPADELNCSVCPE